MKERILQFGEGGFLRGFFEPMVQQMNDQGLFDSSVVCVKPRPGKKDMQLGHYTVLTQGIENGSPVEKVETIHVISRYLGCYEDFDQVLALAGSEDLKMIVSNTTEAGLQFVPQDRLDDSPPSSFPGKVTQWLYRRYQIFDGDQKAGLILMPMELVQNNGQLLKSLILQYASQWKLESEFFSWVSTACTFINTLVDRIVPGFPKDVQFSGYRDPYMVAVEPYSFMALEPVEAEIAPLREELPLEQAGLNVIWTKDLTPYRMRKVRILNGSHTAMSMCALPSGLETVSDCMHDLDYAAFIDTLLRQEILPTIPFPEDELLSYVEAVKDRFLNHALHHRLSSIALNSVSKWKVRLLPVLMDLGSSKKAPCLCFSLAALMQYYMTASSVQDDPSVMIHFQAMKDLTSAEACDQTLARADFWGEDLRPFCGLTEAVSENLKKIRMIGVREAMKACLR